MKDNYQRALTVMTELCQFECDRIEMNAPIQWGQLQELYSINILQRFTQIHDIYLV